jgi:hypothetical protein
VWPQPRKWCKSLMVSYTVAVFKHLLLSFCLLSRYVVHCFCCHGMFITISKNLLKASRDFSYHSIVWYTISKNILNASPEIMKKKKTVCEQKSGHTHEQKNFSTHRQELRKRKKQHVQLPYQCIARFLLLYYVQFCFMLWHVVLFYHGLWKKISRQK